MFQIYFCISAVILVIALSIGLVGGYSYSLPTVTDGCYYWLAAEITAYAVISIALLIILALTIMKKRGFTIKITKELIENHNHEEEEEDEKFFE